MQAPLKFTANTAISIAEQLKADTLRVIADFVEKYECEPQEIIEMLREYADYFEAQSMVVGLRDQL